MKVDFDRGTQSLGQHLPRGVVSRWLSTALGEHHLALCLHRVLPAIRPFDWQPEYRIHPDELDRLTELLLGSRRSPGKRWLTLAFDDGYRDAMDYVRDRAPRFSEVEYLLFVCPEKTERRVGFRWDLVEELTEGGLPLPEAKQRMDEPLDVVRENHRTDLAALAQREAFALATVEELRAVAQVPNVALGNHSNCHYKFTRLDPGDARLELERSHSDFQRLFGPQRQFAFPFGTPRSQFGPEHVAAVRAHGEALIWSTEPRPFHPRERRPGAVLPRFPVSGDHSHLGIATWLAARSSRFRLRGTQHHY